MSELKTKLINRALDLGLYAGQSEARIINDEWEVVERDYNSTLTMLADSIKDSSEESISPILDAHMDTLVKTVINLIVSSVTENALSEKEVYFETPDIVEYIKNHKEEYNIN